MTETKRLGPRPAEPRHPVVKPHIIQRSDRCINCGKCIEACIYSCHERSAEDPRIMADPKTDCCRSCFACIRNCPRFALTLVPNEEYAQLGDETYTPEIVCSLREQATTGKIPVSGAGYGGAFDGPGFDGIWTDMSEIVRPTRDGIHGREHISTTVAFGRMVSDLCGMIFDEQQNLKSLIPPNRAIPIPVIFRTLPFTPGENPVVSLALAASQLNSYFTIRPEQIPARAMEYFNHLVISLSPDEIADSREILEWATIIELTEQGDQIEAVKNAREINPHLLSIINVSLNPDVDKKILDLARRGAETIHLRADTHGRGRGGSTLIQQLAASHRLLVENGLRDRVTLLASGGIALAEHVAKTIILGADAVKVDIPLLIAMECTLCGNCSKGLECPRGIGDIDPRWGAARVINLMVSWRDQLLEVLGAMGIRDIRRLRGETGRAIFTDRALQDFLQRLSQSNVNGRPGKRLTAMKIDRKPRSAPQRFNLQLGEYLVRVDRQRCTGCGICADTCRQAVHRMIDGKLALEEPNHGLCLGPDCRENDWCCIPLCPWEALSFERDPANLTLGDRRWTADLLRLIWKQAETGRPLQLGESEQTGDSGGGFDRLRFNFKTDKPESKAEGIDLSIPLNKRPYGPRLDIPLPIYGGGMSYGSISLQVMLGRAMAAKELGTLTCTGEGGYPSELAPYADHVITQVATGLFGVREETIARARVVEFKYAQGAKPGLGGHLLAEKNTPDVADMREAVPGTGLFSPFPFHSVYSVEDHKKHIDWLRAIKPDLMVSVKVSTPADVDMVAVGSYHAGANIIHLDGAYGGTGAAPDIAKKNIAQPVEYATAQVHDFLVKEGIRDEVTLMVSGGIRTADDVLKAIALGADGVVIGTAELVAIDCVRCRNCERDRGCPIGIATTDPDLSPQLKAAWVRDRIINMYLAWIQQMEDRLREFGLLAIRELRGRRDLLEYMDQDL